MYVQVKEGGRVRVGAVVEGNGKGRVSVDVVILGYLRYSEFNFTYGNGFVKFTIATLFYNHNSVVYTDQCK